MRRPALAVSTLVALTVGSGLAAAPAGADTTDTQGRWSIRSASSQTYAVTWTSPAPLPVTDARPEIRLRGQLVPATVAADGRTVSATVTSAQAPRADALDVVLGDRQLDAPRSETREETAAPVVRPDTVASAFDPGRPGSHAVTTSDYFLDPYTLPDIPKPSEVVGHVVAPTDATDASPLVLFLHGRHIACFTPDADTPPLHPFPKAGGAWRCRGHDKPVPSYLGYDYVQRLLAGQGYVTVSISADAINDLDYNADDGGAAARSALVRHHLDQWTRFVAQGRYHADLGNVVLVGHSRGGEGVDQASRDIRGGAPYRISGQVLLAPTDFAARTASHTPTVTVLPYCDGDVFDLQGQHYTDLARDAAGRVAFHSSVLVMGADHNFFNSEWTPGVSIAPSEDDWFGGPNGFCGTNRPGRLTAQEQRAVGKSYIAGAVALFASNQRAALPLYDGSPVSLPSAGNADVRSHAVGGGSTPIRPAVDADPAPAATAATRLCQGLTYDDDSAACDPTAEDGAAPHWVTPDSPARLVESDLEVAWSAIGQLGGLAPHRALDLSRSDRLDLRTIVDPATSEARFAVRLVDTAGHHVDLRPVVGRVLRPLPGNNPARSKRWAQDVRVDLTGLTGLDTGLDTGHISRIQLVTTNGQGKVWLLDALADPDGGVSVDPTS